MKMQSSSELNLSKICHRCGNPISWWDRFRGYKTQCPSCEKIVHEMVSARILAAKNPPPQPQTQTVQTDRVTRTSPHMFGVDPTHDDQMSISRSAPRGSVDRMFFEDQIRRQMSQAQATALTQGSAMYAQYLSPYNLQQYQQQQMDRGRAEMMAQQQIRGGFDEHGRRRPPGTRAVVMRVAEARARGLEEFMRGYNDEDRVIVYSDENTGMVTRVDRVEIRNQPPL